MRPTWKGDGADRDGRPRFGAAARAWLRRRLVQELPRRLDCPPSDERRDALADWFVARWPQVVAWVDPDTFRGYTVGEWHIAWERVVTLLPEAERWAHAESCRRRDAQRFPTLDAWLEAERAGRLWYKGAEEPGTDQLLPVSISAVLYAAREQRRRTWPRLCVGCAAEFRPNRSNAKRCPSCVGGARAAKDETPETSP